MTVLHEMTEKELHAQIIELAKLLGWKRFHTYRSTRSPAGFPDEFLVRDRIVLLELKTAKGKLSPAQADWIRALSEAKAEVYVIRPDDLQLLASVLGSRRDIYGHLSTDAGRRARAALNAGLSAELG